MGQQVRYYEIVTRLAEAEHVKQQKNVIGAKAHPISVTIYERKGLLGNIVCGELLSSTDGQSRNNIERVSLRALHELHMYKDLWF